MADHKYIRREGSKGNYKYIYEEDLKNTKNYYNDHSNTRAGHKVTSGEVQGPPEVSKEYLEAYRANTKKNDYTPHVVPANNTPKQPTNNNHTFTLGPNGTSVPVKNAPQKKEAKNPFAGVGKAIGGFGKGVAKSFNSGEKAANTFGKGIISGTTKVANNLRKDVKNVGSKLVMGADGAVDKIKDVAETGVQKAREAVGSGLVSAADAVAPVEKSLDNMLKNVKTATQKVIDDNKTVTKSGEEYTRRYRDSRIGSISNIESVKGKKKDVDKFDKAYQTDFAATRATANKEDAYDAMQKTASVYDKLSSDYNIKEAGVSVDDGWDRVKVDDLRKKYPNLAKRPFNDQTHFMFDNDKYPVTYPKALEKDFYEMMDSAEEYAKASDHYRKTQDHEALAEKVRNKAYDDYDKSGAKKRLQMRAKAN